MKVCNFFTVDERLPATKVMSQPRRELNGSGISVGLQLVTGTLWVAMDLMEVLETLENSQSTSAALFWVL
jgi:hypothetical protein